MPKAKKYSQEDLFFMDKSEASNYLFGQIPKEAITKAGTQLVQSDVSHTRVI